MKSNKNIEFNAAFDLIHENSVKRPDKIAFIDDDNVISYLELSNKVKSFAHNLYKTGLKKNDRVIICMHDCINFSYCLSRFNMGRNSANMCKYNASKNDLNIYD